MIYPFDRQLTADHCAETPISSLFQGTSALIPFAYTKINYKAQEVKSWEMTEVDYYCQFSVVEQ